MFEEELDYGCGLPTDYGWIATKKDTTEYVSEEEYLECLTDEPDMASNDTSVVSK